MKDPDHLYRITYDKDLKFDEEGFLATHYEDTNYSRRSVPLAEEQDLEGVARFFLFNKLMIFDQPFLVLKVLASDVLNRTTRIHALLEGREHHGAIHKDAIKSILKGEWIRDFEPSVGEKFRNHPLGTQILEDTYGKKPIILAEVSPQEFSELLGKLK